MEKCIYLFVLFLFLEYTFKVQVKGPNLPFFKTIFIKFFLIIVLQLHRAVLLSLRCYYGFYSYFEFVFIQYLRYIVLFQFNFIKVILLCVFVILLVFILVLNILGKLKENEKCCHSQLLI